MLELTAGERVVVKIGPTLYGGMILRPAGTYIVIKLDDGRTHFATRTEIQTRSE